MTRSEIYYKINNLDTAIEQLDPLAKDMLYMHGVIPNKIKKAFGMYLRLHREEQKELKNEYSDTK